VSRKESSGRATPAALPVPIRSAVLVALLLLAVLYTAYFAAAILVPIVGAVLLNFLFSPMINWAARRAIPRAVAAVVIILWSEARAAS
jgi:predicted PurR-regulated permease PerM